MTRDLEIRPYHDDDAPSVQSLLRGALGWLSDADQTGFFSWKHQHNPFGVSPAWVAVDGERIAGFRTFLRWEFERKGEVVRAVRAVDTATDQDYRGRGLFSRLTMQALEELRREGVSFVFNTPNDQSRPGYLKMGWVTVGRVPVRVRPRSVPAVLSMAQARVPAELASVPTEVGVPAADALTDVTGVARLLASRALESGLRTRLSPEFLAWRYGSFPALAYRAVLAGARIDEGVALFRLRRRGPALEAAMCDVITPGGDRRLLASLVRTVLRASAADYAVAIGSTGDAKGGFLPLPRQGPILTFRALGSDGPPAIRSWRLTAGDIELF